MKFLAAIIIYIVTFIPCFASDLVNYPAGKLATPSTSHTSANNPFSSESMKMAIQKAQARRTARLNYLNSLTEKGLLIELIEKLDAIQDDTERIRFDTGLMNH
jgi:hypothetical protein